MADSAMYFFHVAISLIIVVNVFIALVHGAHETKGEISTVVLGLLAIVTLIAMLAMMFYVPVDYWLYSLLPLEGELNVPATVLPGLHLGAVLVGLVVGVVAWFFLSPKTLE